MRVSWNETDPHRGPLTQGPRSAGEGADSVVRADDVEALRLPLVGEVRGPEGPITWLPTLNRGREALQTQGLMRVVTDTPVTTRAVAKATRESGGQALGSGCLTALASRFAVDRGVVHARCDGPTRGSVAPSVVSPRRRSSRRPVAPWELRWRPTYARSGSSGDVRSLYDRPRVVKRSRGQDFVVLPLNAPWLGTCISHARIERDARVSQPGDP